MSRVVALDGEASLMSRSETMPTRRPSSSTTGSRLKPFSFMSLAAFMMEVAGLAVIGVLLIQSLISMGISLQKVP